MRQLSTDGNQASAGSSRSFVPSPVKLMIPGLGVSIAVLYASLCIRGVLVMPLAIHSIRCRTQGAIKRLACVRTRFNTGCSFRDDASVGGVRRGRSNDRGYLEVSCLFYPSLPWLAGCAVFQPSRRRILRKIPAHTKIGADAEGVGVGTRASVLSSSGARGGKIKGPQSQQQMAGKDRVVAASCSARRHVGTGNGCPSPWWCRLGSPCRSPSWPKIATREKILLSTIPGRTQASMSTPGNSASTRPGGGRDD
jgi:hypothetical protein